MHVLPQVHDGPVHVLAIDHGFRPTSAHEAAGVADAARALGLTAHVASLGLPSGAGAMERARDARMAVAEVVRAREGLDLMATGHTRTDRAETVIFRLARGTGRRGAIGMAPRRDLWIRPLLDVSREETHAWCQERGLAVVDDPTNADLRTARARVRHGVMPALDAVHSEAEAHVVGFADLLADEDEVIATIVDAAWNRHTRHGGLDAAGLVVEPPAVARLLARRLIAEAGLPGDALARGVIDDVLECVATGTGRRDVPGGLIALDRGVLVVETAPVATMTPQYLAVPGSVRMGSRLIRATSGRAAITSSHSAWVRATGPLVVRAPRDGDRIALPDGGHQAVGRLLQSAGVPARHRGLVPVVADAHRILWIAGHRADPEVVALPGDDAVHLEVVSG